MDDLPITVRVETTELDAAGRRQIATRSRPTALLAERRLEIQQAISETIVVVRAPLANSEPDDHWYVAEISATFGITLSAEAGVIITRAAAEASFEVTITLKRAEPS
jgi:NTP-dependent ternary system trypsin peptidase co-occuring protein